MFEVVVVLYNMTYSESPTIVSLNQLLASGAFPEIRKILIFDNSVSSTIPEGLDKRFVYYHSKTNVGLAKAYNYALGQSSDDTEWLITLDQDTILTKEYLEEMTSKYLEVPERVVAIAPIIKDSGQQISPVRNDTLRPLNKALPKKDCIYSQDIMVINSATAIRLSFLEQIGGYNEEFQVDYLDHWVSWAIFKYQKEVYVLNEILTHSLSVLHGRELSFSRYREILRSENIFYSKYKKNLFQDYKKHLFMRGLKQLLFGRAVFFKATIKTFFKILM
ncbi:glycosyltransferase [Enterococcus sp. DIV0756]|uniref:glycosyltransferase n=1 Tax=Enterococcus sp. DIV0756 TaxID=2774636 RepID=UPI003F27C1CE